MKSTIIATATAFTLLIANAASAVTPGEAQFAASLGVTPGEYSASELAQLSEYQRENDKEGVAFILSRSGSSASKDTAGLRQAALALGVEPGRYSAAELEQIRNARRDNDRNLEALILSTADGVDNDISSKAPLAAALGLNANDYTRAQLVALYTTAEENRNND